MVDLRLASGSSFVPLAQMASCWGSAERPGSAGRREPTGDHENIFCAGSAATASSARRMRYSAASTRSSNATDSISPLPSIPERGLSRCVTQVCCCPGIQQYPQVRDRPEVGCLHKRAPPSPICRAHVRCSTPYRIAASSISMFISFSVLNLMQ